MTSERVEVDKTTCDGCGKVTTSEAEEIAAGFHLTVTHVTESGSSGDNDIFACTPKCIRPAVMNALTEQRT